jgi:poly(3-hydroxybutyrate) depolymerase
MVFGHNRTMREKRYGLFVVWQAVVFALLMAAPARGRRAAPTDPVERLTFSYNGAQRTYFCLIPSAADAGALPVVVLLHGSDHDGSEMTNAWRGLATQEKFILAAPNSLHSDVWNSQVDSPAFLHAVVEQVAARHAVDPKRIYLFGHSGGANYALALALLDSGYFAAVGAHAGSLDDSNDKLFRYAQRKTPVALWVGDEDPLFPVTTVKATRDTFAAHGFPVQLTVIPNHRHFYEEDSKRVNAEAWEFFRRVSLP